MRESGAIEQDADMVMFLYRPDYYGITEDEEGNSTHGLAEVIVSKNRNGALDTAKLRFIPHLTKFENFDNLDFKENFESVMSPNYGVVDRKVFNSKMNDVHDDDVPNF